MSSNQIVVDDVAAFPLHTATEGVVEARVHQGTLRRFLDHAARFFPGLG